MGDYRQHSTGPKRLKLTTWKIGHAAIIYALYRLNHKSCIKLCQDVLPDLLGIKEPCVVGRAHRLGPPQPQERKSPRPVMVKYFNYMDKMAISQAFRDRRSLTYDENSLLLFAQPMFLGSARRFKNCMLLHGKQMRFTLAYLVLPRVTSQQDQPFT